MLLERSKTSHSSTTQGYLDCAHPSFILTHAQGIPFGRKNGFSERRNLCVSLCGLFGGLHARGWRAASKCNLDARKRRSSILFTFSPQQGCYLILIPNSHPKF